MGSVEPKYISPVKGKGLFATKDFKVGEVLFEEDAYLYALDPECQVTSFVLFILFYFTYFILLYFVLLYLFYFELT